MRTVPWQRGSEGDGGGSHVLPKAPGAGRRAPGWTVRGTAGAGAGGSSSTYRGLAVFTRKETQTFQAPRVPEDLRLPASVSSCKQDVQLLSVLGSALGLIARPSIPSRGASCPAAGALNRRKGWVLYFFESPPLGGGSPAGLAFPPLPPSAARLAWLGFTLPSCAPITALLRQWGTRPSEGQLAEGLGFCLPRLGLQGHRALSLNPFSGLSLAFYRVLFVMTEFLST